MARPGRIAPVVPIAVPLAASGTDHRCVGQARGVPGDIGITQVYATLDKLVQPSCSGIR